MKTSILLVGLGPHSKRIYISGLRNLGLQPAVIVDLESKQRDVEEFVRKERLNSALFFISDAERDYSELSKRVQGRLDQVLVQHKITHAIISTEPKAHYAYLQYLIVRKVSILTDKPITAPAHVINDPLQALKIQSEYHHLLDLAEQHKTAVTVQCQRRYDKRYQWIRERVQEVCREYGIPISYMHITHCDGSWNMPNEFFSRENHPYKYGYGKIFHSGYHFIDLMAFLLSYDELPEEKLPSDGFVTSVQYGPHDQMFSLDEPFYEKVLGKKGYAPYFHHWENGRYQEMGELDVLALYAFSRGAHTITTCSLDLLQSGFSRRAWSHLPIDNYKGNGRIRHETISVQVGPLFNLQVHSYQAHEVKERSNREIDHFSAGGLEHFDVHMFRNNDLIGGKPHEVWTGKDLYAINSEGPFIGYNEQARHECLLKFIYNEKDHTSTLEGQAFTIDLVMHTYMSMCRKRLGESPTSQFKLREYLHGSAEFCGGVYC